MVPTVPIGTEGAKAPRRLQSSARGGMATPNVPPQSRVNRHVKKKRAEEDALLAKYSKGGGKTLDERIAERQKESTERDRVPNL